MQPVIKINNLYKQYTSGETQVNALKNINLKIAQNEFVAIMGPSGSGKSTLMNIMGCLDKPTSGEYLLNHKNTAGLKDKDLATIRNKEIGFVFQQFHLLPRLTVLENVMLPLVYAGEKLRQRQNRAKMVLGKVELTDKLFQKPNQLSGGQCQRVAIARALINNPAIILADEPTGNLDSKTSHDIMQVFTQLHQNGNTIILITHEEEIAQFAKRKIIIKDGEIVSDQFFKPI